MSYISREAAIRIISGYQDEPVDKSVAKRLLTQLPSADVVEVVRCKDCKHFLEDEEIQEKYCEFDLFIHLKSDYCSNGERRTDG